MQWVQAGFAVAAQSLREFNVGLDKAGAGVERGSGNMMRTTRSLSECQAHSSNSGRMAFRTHPRDGSALKGNVLWTATRVSVST